MKRFISLLATICGFFVLLVPPYLSSQNVYESWVFHADKVEKLVYRLPVNEAKDMRKINKRLSLRAVKQIMDSLVVFDTDLFSGELIPYYKAYFEYNASGQVLRRNNFYLDEDLGIFVQGVRYEYEYNTNGERIQEIDYFYNAFLDKFIPESKFEWKYNENGVEVETSSFEFDEATDRWIPISKNTYEYGVKGKIIVKESFLWDKSINAFIPGVKVEYKYNADGKVDLVIDYSFINSSIKWVPISKREIEYKSNGKEISSKGYIYINSTDLWMLNSQTIVYYNDNDRPIKEVYLRVVENSSELLPQRKTEFTFDQNGNLIEETDAKWDKSLNVWFFTDKVEYVYNNAYSFEDLILPFFNDEGELIYFNSMLTGLKEFEWDENSNAWTQIDSVRFYYSEYIPTSTDNVLESQVIIYPNPFNDQISFELPAGYQNVYFELFDASGNRILSKNLDNDKNLLLTGLSEGIYFYKMIMDKGSFTGKLIKQ